MPHSDNLIADLVGQLEPVRPLGFARGLAYALAAAALSVVAIVGLFGLRPDLAVGRFDPMHIVSSGLFLMLGIAASATVVMMSRPRVGIAHDGWTWVAATTALLPVAGVAVAISRSADVFSAQSVGHGIECFATGGAGAVLVFAALTAWLRKGAPTSPDLAGLLTGIAAGSFGIFAFGLHCADNDIVHIGLWHSAVVLVMAGLGRALVPALVRW
jgi:hypothetical protein